MNLYQIYDAAFDDTHGEYIQNTRQYIYDYAWGMDVDLDKWQVDEILKSRLEWLDIVEQGRADSNEFWHCVVKRLEEIEV